MTKRRSIAIGPIVAIARNTVTELIRQKIFYFLIVFPLLLIGSSLFLGRLTFAQEFQVLKDISLGAMSLFSSLLAIVATARLLPQEIEDRTIYTILARPVSRFEYLCGKLAGVLSLLALSLSLMTALFCVVLYLREQTVLAATERQLAALPAGQLQEALRGVHAAAFTSNLLPGIALIYFKACLLASLTLFVSTFAASSLFTVFVMVVIYFIGHLQASARAYWLYQYGGSWLTRLFLALVALFFPDLQAFNFVDDIVAGAAIPLAIFWKTTLLGGSYVAIYLLLAAVVFYAKEL
jgi:ABC-type Na+ efflux pump permease subunit